MKLTLIAEQLFDGTHVHANQPITFEDGYIHSLDTVSGAKEIYLNGLLTPGFVDCQVNGGGGLLFNQEPNLACLQQMVQAHARFGTTSILPTVISSDLSLANQAADAVAKAISQQMAGILGIHFEGPHLSLEKNGIHNKDVIRPLGASELGLYLRQDLGKVLVTVAPENVGSLCIQQLCEHQVNVSLGHSNATFAQTNAALAAGASGFTHVFNAMSQLNSREPGMVGAALFDTKSWCGLIVDGHHVHPAAARIALNAKPQGKVFLVTDAMWTPGAATTQFAFDKHQITLSNNKLVSHTGQLAGAAISMIDAINNCVELLHVDVWEALRMATLYPAQFLNMQSKVGQLIEGAYADCVWLSPPGQGRFKVKNTWLRGQSLLSTEEIFYEQN